MKNKILDLIKQSEELQKIIEVQKQVKKELNDENDKDSEKPELKEKNPEEKNKEDVKQEQVADAQDAYEVNENKELNSLISKYYELYAAGNVDELAQIATPFSDMEKSYVQMMSGYVESYNNIDCYSKRGLEQDSYMVSATYEMKLSGAEGTVPGMEFFYVRSKEDGSFYIDNAYGTFNSQMEELETDPEVMALIEKFNDASDVKELVADFQSRYTQAIEQDENLRNAVNNVTAGIVSWKDAYVAQQQAAAANGEVWKCTQRLNNPPGYQNGLIRLELVQDVNGEPQASTIVDEAQITFPYQLDVTGAPGVSEGTIYLYEQINGNYQKLGDYAVTFEKAE